MSKMTTEEILAKYPHYYKDVRHLEVVDVYRVIDLFGVTDPTAQHALKKLLVPGKRTAGKSPAQDLDEAVNTLIRGQLMREEDKSRGLVSTATVMPVAPRPPTPMPSPAKLAEPIKFCSATGCNNRTTDATQQTCFHHSAPVPYSGPQMPAPPPAPPTHFHCIENGCTLPAKKNAIRCEKHCLPPAQVEPRIAVIPPTPVTPVQHAPWCQEKCAAIACPCYGWESKVPMAPVKTEDKTPLRVEKPAPMPYTAPTEPMPVPRGPVAAPPAPKL